MKGCGGTRESIYEEKITMRKFYEKGESKQDKIKAKHNNKEVKGRENIHKERKQIRCKMTEKKGKLERKRKGWRSRGNK